MQQARKLKKVKIVSYDWLEDCLLKRSKIRETGQYLLAKAVKERVKEKQRKKTIREQEIAKGSTACYPLLSNIA